MGVTKRDTKRSKFSIIFSEEQRKKLEALALAEGRSVASWLRRMIELAPMPQPRKR
jgi:hypothetical protein